MVSAFCFDHTEISENISSLPSWILASKNVLPIAVQGSTTCAGLKKESANLSVENANIKARAKSIVKPLSIWYGLARTCLHSTSSNNWWYPNRKHLFQFSWLLDILTAGTDVEICSMNPCGRLVQFFFKCCSSWAEDVFHFARTWM